MSSISWLSNVLVTKELLPIKDLFLIEGLFPIQELFLIQDPGEPCWRREGSPVEFNRSSADF